MKTIDIMSAYYKDLTQKLMRIRCRNLGKFFGKRLKKFSILIGAPRIVILNSQTIIKFRVIIINFVCQYFSLQTIVNYRLKTRWPQSISIKKKEKKGKPVIPL